MAGLEQKVEELESRVKNLEKVLEDFRIEQNGIARLKTRFGKPVTRTPEDMAEALKIVGAGEGPEDLAEKSRQYLRGEKR